MTNTSMPSRFAAAPALSPNGLLMQPNGKSAKRHPPQFAERSHGTAEQRALRVIAAYSATHTSIASERTRDAIVDR
jgi:hypothetical protein